MIGSTDVKRIIPLIALLLAQVSCVPLAPPPTLPSPPAGPEAVPATAISFTEGPAVDAAGDVYFTDTTSARILRFSPQDRKLTTFRENSNRANGLVFDGQGRLLACESGAHRLTRTDMKTGRIEVLAQQYEGKDLNGPNDVTLDGKGRIYFTDPAPGSKAGAQGVYRIDTDGKLNRILSAPETEWPNGIMISPDDRRLYLVEANKVERGKRAIMAYDLSPEGTVSNGRVHYNFYPGRSADGMSIDTRGNLYAAAGMHRRRGTHETLDTRTGIYVISPEGKLLQFTPIHEDTVTNCAFGGPDDKTLYVTAGKTLFQIRYEIAGLRR